MGVQNNSIYLSALFQCANLTISNLSFKLNPATHLPHLQRALPRDQTGAARTLHAPGSTPVMLTALSLAVAPLRCQNAAAFNYSECAAAGELNYHMNETEQCWHRGSAVCHPGQT